MMFQQIATADIKINAMIKNTKTIMDMQIKNSDHHKLQYHLSPNTHHGVEVTDKTDIIVICFNVYHHHGKSYDSEIVILYLS